MIKLVIFDLDGTAVDTLESLAYSVNRVMRRLGLREMPVENFKYYAGDGARKMIKRCLKDAGDPTASQLEDALDIYREEFKKGCTYHVKPFPGLTETLEDLREYGVFLAICTNKGQSYAEAVIKKVYGKNTVAVQDFNLDIADKEFIVFVGPSGCGKSTTLRMIAGLEEISSGEL